MLKVAIYSIMPQHPENMTRHVPGLIVSTYKVIHNRSQYIALRVLLFISSMQGRGQSFWRELPSHELHFTTREAK